MSEKIAILIPCYNEAITIRDVISSFRKELPEAAIYVYDNNSQDKTIEMAKKAGAIVRTEERQGKGHVVRRMFADVEADIYVMIDGDATYHAPSVGKLIQKLKLENLDMVVGCRKASEKESYRSGHRFGNKLFTIFVSLLFGQAFSDILSGYRVFSRRFVKTFPCVSGGFEIETELTIHSLDMLLPVGEVDTPYGVRPDGSESKLSTYTDGLRILRMIFLLAKEIRPFVFFGGLALLCTLLSLGTGIPVILDYFETGLVARFPTAILSTGLMIIAFLCFFSGIILDSLSRGRKEHKKLQYLSYKPLGE